MDQEERRQLWQARVADYRQSGLRMKEWCVREGCTTDQLKYWLYKRAKKTSNVASPATTQRFIPVTLASVSLPVPSLQIHIGTARIEVIPGFDPELLREVVRALEEPC
jgi:hypothetical protein